jgi:hypothetical protein
VTALPPYGEVVRPVPPDSRDADAQPPAPGSAASSAASPGSDFDVVAAGLRRALDETRSEIVLTETRGPSKLAPHALAVLASVRSAHAPDDELAVGRLVLLHDPDGQPAWDGTYRIACFARAELDPEMGTDPVLPEVTWSWLEEALGAAEAEADALAGTVTVTRSSRFGGLAEDDDAGTSEVELRCSWTPRFDDDPARHLRAFCGLLADVAGLPPDVPGVVALSARRR